MEVHRMKPRWSLLLIGTLLSILLVAPTAALADATGDVEISSWWAGDGGPALEAIIREFEARHPGVRINNATVTGGAGVNAKAVLKTRMLGGDPPGTFQVHAGQELIGTWVIEIGRAHV